MIQVITALENEFARDMARHAEAHEDALYTPGLSVGAIESGWPYKPWASPAVCCAYVDFRIPLGFTPLAAERALREFLRGLERRDPDLSVEMEVFLSKASNSTPRDSFVYRSCLRHYERLVGPYERSTHPLASYSDDTCIMREQAMDAVVFGAGGVRYRGLSDSEGLGIGGEAVRIDDLVQLARIYAATAVDVCGRSRDAIPSGADAAGAAGRAARVGS